MIIEYHKLETSKQLAHLFKSMFTGENIGYQSKINLLTNINHQKKRLTTIVLLLFRGNWYVKKEDYTHISPCTRLSYSKRENSAHCLWYPRIPINQIEKILDHLSINQNQNILL